MLFLAAFAPELDALDSFAERDTVGVGLIESALGTARILALRKPDAVILLGTAGAFPSSGLAIGEVVVAERIVLAARTGALVEAMPAALDTDPDLVSRFGIKRALVATTLAITTDDADALAIERETGAIVEHLEAFAVGRACALANVPFTAVLGIANIVGSRGRAEWRSNHIRASAAACVAVRNPTRAQSPA